MKIFSDTNNHKENDWGRNELWSVRQEEEKEEEDLRSWRCRWTRGEGETSSCVEWFFHFTVFQYQFFAFLVYTNIIIQLIFGGIADFPRGTGEKLMSLKSVCLPPKHYD